MFLSPISEVAEVKNISTVKVNVVATSESLCDVVMKGLGQEQEIPISVAMKAQWVTGPITVSAHSISQGYSGGK